MTTYRCNRHNVVAVVDEAHRSATLPVDLAIGRAAPGSCWLARNWHLALPTRTAPADPGAILGDHGPWHPRFGAAACHVEREA